MPGASEPSEPLQARIDELARREAEGLLTEALARAREQVLEELTETVARSLREHLGAGPAQGRPGPRAARTRSDTSASAGPPETPRPTPEEIQPAPPPALSAAAAREPGAGELAWYVYGVVGADDAPAAEGLAGIESDHPATALVEGSVAAVVSRVALAEFAEATLRTHLSDMAWVEATARAHEQTLDLLSRRTAVIPMRMCSVYRTEDGVREMLGREEQALADGLAHLAGKAEWGVKVFADQGLRHARPPDEPVELETEGSPGAGAAYLARKREERDAGERVAQLIDETARQIHERLRAAASEGRVLPPQQVEPGGPEMILNGVYLVAAEEEAAFHDRIGELQRTFGPLGVELEETGPWPAYNFVPGTIGATW